MPDPIRFIIGWPSSANYGWRGRVWHSAGQIHPRDPLQESVRIISRNELRVWFEPNWQNARYLARRFPHCTICSIPAESDTINLHRIPGWRHRRQDLGIRF